MSSSSGSSAWWWFVYTKREALTHEPKCTCPICKAVQKLPS